MLVTDFIIEYLKRNEGVTHVFTYAGGTDAPLINSLYCAKGITYIPVRHEQNASLAAVGYALASERLGAAIAMSGPGATNMVTGIADAWFDSVPVLYITGQVTTGTYKFDNPARQIGYQETDIISIVKSITKSSELVLDKNTFASKLISFISGAKSGRPGPVLIDIPFDVLRQDIPDTQINEKSRIKDPPPVSPVLVDSFLSMVREARRPLIVAGGGIKTKEARELVTRFAETLRIPVVTSLMGKDAFPNESPLYFGFIGAYGSRCANITMANSDLIIAVGSRLDSRQTSVPRHFARQAKKIQIDIDRNELNNNIPLDLPVHADLLPFLKAALEKAGKAEKEKYREWMDYFQKVKKEFEVTKDYKGSEENVNPLKFLFELSLKNNKDTVYLADVGNNQMFAARALVVKKNQRFLTSGGLGTMGFAIPASLGAHYGAPESQIIAIMGDGGFQMASQELQTIRHFNMPVKMIVLNNSILGLMKVFQDENYPGNYCATVEGYSCPDLQKIAEAYGIRHKKVSTTGEAVDFIPEFLSEKGPFLLEAVVHKDWTGYPKMKRGMGIEHQEPLVSDEKLKEFMLIPLLKPEK